MITITSDNVEFYKSQLVEAVFKHLGIINRALKDLGISKATYLKWLRDDPDFKMRIEESRDLADDFAETALLKLIKEGNPQAIIFYAKTRLKHRGYAETAPQVQGSSQISVSFLPINHEPQTHLIQPEGMAETDTSRSETMEGDCSTSPIRQDSSVISLDTTRRNTDTGQQMGIYSTDV